jgi:hypothetical protein
MADPSQFALADENRQVLKPGEFIVEWAFRLRSNVEYIGAIPVWTGQGYFEKFPKEMLTAETVDRVVKLVSDQFRETLDREIGRTFDTAKSEKT